MVKLIGVWKTDVRHTKTLPCADSEDVSFN